MYRYILSKLIPSSISFNFDMLSDQFLEFTLIISHNSFVIINLSEQTKFCWLFVVHVYERYFEVRA